MRLFVPVLLLATNGLLVSAPPPAAAQTIESVGSRALGMGGAFTAVASDGTATWWNPGALAAGPFFDSSLGWAFDRPLGARRGRAGWFALGTPPLGLSYYRLSLASSETVESTGEGFGHRDDDGGAVPVSYWQVSQWGVTLVQTLLPGVHAGTTLKYLRRIVRYGTVPPAVGFKDRLDAAEGLEGGERASRFDLDVGLLAVMGPVRLGTVVRRLLEPEFPAGEPSLPRQARIGAAYDPAFVGGPPVVLSFDADLRTYRSATGERRVVAAGVEQWLMERRLGLRAGIRQNTAGDRERAYTAGASVRLAGTSYVDGYVVRGRAFGERGWGLAMRVSY